MIYDGVITKPPIEQLLAHAGIKGMEWNNHKYIKKANGTYYYPEGSNAAKPGEYKDGDSDFDEKNYDEKNRLGDSDFFAFTRPDGKVVILEEDMKWELPEGQKVDKDMINRLSNLGPSKSNDEFINKVTSALSGGSDGKLSDKDKDNLSDMIIRGEFKNGKERKDLLGDNYKELQDLVNKKLKGKSESKSEDTKKSKSEDKKESKNEDYEVKEGNNHYRYKVRKKNA